ncbi:MAG TPA: hypothetical protein VGM20_05680 [Gemmatimonadales bacterium]|jgi:hypothetical protein
MAHIPTLHETHFDLSLVEHFSNVAAPTVLPSQWVVRMDIHYLGGMHHWGSWEIADIGILFLLRRGGKVRKGKIALLQSKRLYPIEQDFEEDRPIDYQVGFGRLWQSDLSFAKSTEARTFSFSTSARYKALTIDDEQYRAIREYERTHQIPVHYMLYHPTRIPLSQSFPLSPRPYRRRRNDVGVRVVPAAALRDSLASREKGYSPSYGDLLYLLRSPFDEEQHSAGWRLETFVDELVSCRQGYVTTSPNDDGVRRVFSERGAPISAAIALTVDQPE